MSYKLAFVSTARLRNHAPRDAHINSLDASLPFYYCACGDRHQVHFNVAHVLYKGAAINELLSSKWAILDGFRL